MKTYNVKYTLASKPGEDFQYSGDAESISSIVNAVVLSLGLGHNPAEIDFIEITEDGNSLGDQGLYDAEVALASHYE